MTAQHIQSRYHVDKLTHLIPGYRMTGAVRADVCKYTRTRQFKGKAHAREKGSWPNFDPDKLRLDLRLQASRRHHVALRQRAAPIIAHLAAWRQSGPTEIPIRDASVPHLGMRACLQSFDRPTVVAAEALMVNSTMPGPYVRLGELGWCTMPSPRIEFVRSPPRVQTRAWFSDREIMTWLDLFKKHAERGKVFVLQPLDEVWTRSNEPAAIRRRLSHSRHQHKWWYGLTGVRAVIMPLNVHNNHWIVLYFLRATDTLYVLDSFGQAHTTLCNTFLSNLQHVGIASAAAVSTIVDLPRQTDGFECGPWACLYIACLILRRRLPHGRHEDKTYHMRQVMARLICGWPCSQNLDMTPAYQHYLSMHTCNSCEILCEHYIRHGKSPVESA